MRLKNRKRRWGRVLALLCTGVLALAAVAGAAAWLAMRASLPRLDGQLRGEGLSANATIERDTQGSVTVTADNRLDLAYATGYAHGQDRYFQMDLLRRVAAGEVAALVGADAIPLDQRNRMHRFRARAQAAYAALPPAQRELLQRYADGVNAAQAALPVWPFEYGVLGVRPQPWRPEDTLLAIDAMYLDLQSAELIRVLSRGLLRDAVPADMLAFLTPRASAMDAPLDGVDIAAPPLRVPRTRPDWLDGPGLDGPGRDNAGRRAQSEAAAAEVGSNAFAVAGTRAADGAARVANDMHLGLRLPNIWYRLTLVLRGPEPRRISGVSLPGAPVVVAGSNGDVAWAFTNSYGHFIDLIRLERDPQDPRRYRGPSGEWETATEHDEWIQVKGGAPVRRPVLETRWGPEMAVGDQTYAVEWIAHQPYAADLGLLGMETARNVDQALGVAQASGVPTQNILVADSAGHIGWTLAGPLPRATRDPDGYPVEAARAAAPAERLPPRRYPRVVDPPSGRLWTANSTQLGDAGRQRAIGDGGADVGLRGTQIRDGLFARDTYDEQALLAIQLDDRGLWLEFWRQLALDILDQPALAGHPDRAALRRILLQWNGRADVDQAGYTLVRDFRETLYGAWFAGLDERLSARAPELAPAISVGRASSRLEPVMRALVREQAWVPARYANWRAFMLGAIDETIVRNRPRGASLDQADWGERNTLAIGHPFAGLLPGPLRAWFSAPAQAVPGDTNMPRVQRPAFGASERFVVAPGKETQGILEMPGGASGHPMSPFFLAGHQDWVEGAASPFMPGTAAHTLVLRP
ncbi:Penicillin acylase family protein [Bordetella sputigena]|uniref:penicillin acylase family protein n=1 Tax=Bordetella sputigena TaxID=1416810 RepID=UPI0039EFBE59